MADAPPAIVSPGGSLSSTVRTAQTLVVSELAPDISLRVPPVPPWVQRQNVVSSKGSQKKKRKKSLRPCGHKLTSTKKSGTGGQLGSLKMREIVKV